MVHVYDSGFPETYAIENIRVIGWGGDTSEYYTKTQNIIQRPKTLFKAPTDYTKHQQKYTKLKQVIQKPQHV